MDSRFVHSTCPPRDGESGSREAALSAIENLSITPGQRSCLIVLFRLAWPDGKPAEFRPTSWAIDVPVSSDAKPPVPNIASMIGCGRTATKSHLDKLVSRGYLVRGMADGKPNTFRINWNEIYAIKVPVPTPLTPPQSTPSTPPEASDPSGGVGGVFEPDAEAFARRPAEGSDGSDVENIEPGVIELAILRVGNHLANVLRIAVKEAVQELLAGLASSTNGVSTPPTPPEASGSNAEGSKASDPSAGLHKELINELINKSNSIIHLDEEQKSVSDQAKASGGVGGVAAKTFKWSDRLYHGMNAKSLRDLSFVEECFQHVVSLLSFPNDQAGRLRFVALLMDSVKIRPADPGGVLTNKLREAIGPTPEGLDLARRTLAAVPGIKPTTAQQPPIVESISRPVDDPLLAYQKQRQREAGRSSTPDPTGIGNAIGSVIGRSGC